MVVAASIAVLVALSVGAAVAFQHDSGPDVSVQPAQVAPQLPENCIVTAADKSGCEVPSDTASALVGFPVRTPSNLPQGWQRLRGTLRIYRDSLPADEILPPGVHAASLYTQIWAPPGTDLKAPGTCPANLVVRERIAFPGDNNLQGEPAIDLGQGRTAYGSVAEPTACGTGEPLKPFSHLAWVSDGIQFTVTGNSVDHDTMIRVAQSLYR
jgi:hypothetical protein